MSLQRLFTSSYNELGPVRHSRPPLLLSSGKSPQPAPKAFLGLDSRMVPYKCGEHRLRLTGLFSPPSPFFPVPKKPHRILQ